MTQQHWSRSASLLKKSSKMKVFLDTDLQLNNNSFATNIGLGLELGVADQAGQIQYDRSVTGPTIHWPGRGIYFLQSHLTCTQTPQPFPPFLHLLLWDYTWPDGPSTQ